MDNETYILGMYDNEIWSFYDGEGWVCEVKDADRMDRTSAFDLCEKFSLEDLQVCIFKASIFDRENCPETFSFQGEN